MMILNWKKHFGLNGSYKNISELTKDIYDDFKLSISAL